MSSADALGNGVDSEVQDDVDGTELMECANCVDVADVECAGNVECRECACDIDIWGDGNVGIVTDGE
jgi:hypothetical protein